MKVWNPQPLRVVLVVSALSLCASTAAAQLTTTGTVEFGARQLFGNRASSKFLEYRSIPEGFFLNRVDLKLDWGKTAYYATLRSENALEGDQSVKLRAGRRGRYELALDFQKTPHLFTNTGRSLYFEQGPGLFVIPDSVQAELGRISNTDIDPVQPGVQRDLAALNALIDGLSRPVQVSLLREKGKASFRYTPTPEWDLNVQYSLEKEKGSRPFGATFGFNPNEQLEPIDYWTHEIQANVERSGKNWVVRGEYQGGFFRNHVDALVWDNPRQVSDADRNPSAGRIDLYPDNNRHLGTLTAGFGLPMRGRWTTTLGYGVTTQDDPFLPFTINSAVASVPSLPATSANGKIKTLQFNSVLTIKPVRNVRLGLRYRYYDRDNETPSLLFSDYVRTDERLSGTARVNLPFAYTKEKVTVDASWRIHRAISVKGGYEWEGWDRELREVTSTSENTVKGTVDFTHRGWFFLRASFRRSDRDANNYDQLRVENVMFPDGPTAPQLAALRKYDQADRERNRAEFIARVTPVENFSVSASYSLTEDEYDKTEYGLLENTSHTPAVEFSYSPRPEVTIFADYARAKDRFVMRSRQRTPTNDQAANDWVSDIRDIVNTYGGGFSGEFLNAALGVDVSYHRSDGDGRTNTSTPGTPDLVTTAADYPQIISDLQSLQASLRYRLGSGMTVRFEYRFEKYDQVDFALDVMSPFMGIVDAGSARTTWLGVTRPDYRAHVASIVLSYPL